jgi:radical SAM-linked protein
MRVRITFAKQGALRYTGHLDLHKLMERAARRAELPLSYSQGFHPQPKISLAAALPLGFASRDEVMDIRLNEDLEPDDISTRLKNSLPTGIQILKVERVEDSLPPLQTQLLSATYEAHLTEPAEGADLTRKVEALMMSESLPRERRGKAYDLRPLVEMLSVVTESNGKIWLRMTLAAREGATGRPDEVLTALGIEPETVRVERTKLIFIHPSS